MKIQINKNQLNSNIVFNLDTKISPIGTQKDVDDFINYETEKAINPPTSSEIITFLPNTTITYNFLFSDGNSYSNNITNIGITEGDTKSDIGKKCFYLLEFYDNYDLGNIKNLVVGQDIYFILPSFYHIKNFPYNAMYDKKENLITTFEGAIPIEKIISTFK